MRSERDAARADSEVAIHLTDDEALVLLDLLARSQDEDSDDIVRPIHRADQAVLWRLRGTLDDVLAQPFASDYVALVEAARARLTKDFED